MRAFILPLVASMVVAAPIAPAVAVAQSPRQEPTMGVHGSGWEPPSEHTADLTRGLGVGWVRLSIDWPVLQPSESAPILPRHLANLSAIVRGLQARGLHVYFLLDRSPPWARGCDASEHRLDNPRVACTGTMSAPLPPWYDAYEAFVAGMVTHFSGAPGKGPRVTHWAIGNEVNVRLLFNIPEGQDPVAVYVALLSRAARAIHAAGDTVLAPELADTRAPDRHFGYQHRTDRRWLDDFLVAGGQYADIVTVHGYARPTELADMMHGFLTETRLATTRHPVWLTEMGTSRAQPNDAIHAYETTQLFRLMWSGPDTARWKKTFAFALEIPGPYVGKSEGNRTLVKDSNTPREVIRPAYYCMQALAWRRPPPRVCDEDPGLLGRFLHFILPERFFPRRPPG